MFECGHLGHKRFSCPQKNVDNEQLVSVESTENGSFKDNDNTDTVEIIKTRQKVTKKRRFSEGVTEQHNEVSESDVDDAEYSEKAGCNSAVIGHSSRPNEVEDVVYSENVTQTDAQAIEEGSEDELDGMSQYTDDSMKDDDQWSEQAEISKVMKEDSQTVVQINVFIDEMKGKKVEVSDFFPDLDKFIASVMWTRRHVVMKHYHSRSVLD